MGLGRRKVALDDAGAWVFNRMVEAYDARPAYPAALVDALAKLAGPAVQRIGDLGAGIGHLALPLASLGHDVVAVEPALAMLDRLRQAAAGRGLALRAVHAAAERLPLPAASLDLVIIADALHFLDAELAATEIARVLVPRGALALVTCQPGDTPFMRDVVRIIEESVPRRPSDLASPTTHLAALTQVALADEVHFHDQTPVDHATLDRILRSISFIGPAMNPARFAAFQRRVHALSAAPVWARTFTLRVGHREPLSRRAQLRAARAARGSSFLPEVDS